VRPEDRELARRDRGVPGLSLLLDGPAFAKRVADSHPGLEVAPDGPSYLRYKPGTSCIAAFRDPSGDRPALYARAYRSDDAAKLAKALTRLARHREDPLAWDDVGVVVVPYPLDLELPAVAALHQPQARDALLSKILGPEFDLSHAHLEPLHHRPERRFVARVDAAGRSVVVKLHTVPGFTSAKPAAKSFRSRGPLLVPTMLGKSHRHGAVVTAWLEGAPLTDLLSRGDGDAQHLAYVGAALAALNRQRPHALRALPMGTTASRLDAVAAFVTAVLPSRGSRVRELTSKLAALEADGPRRATAIHGDFHPAQVLVRDDGIVILDLDEAVVGDPAVDLGTFLAHVDRNAASGAIPAEVASRAADALLDGYTRASGRVDRQRVDVATATALAFLLPHPFRERAPDWPAGIDALLDAIERILASRRPTRRTRRHVSTSAPADGDTLDDPGIPTLRAALDPRVAGPALAAVLSANGEPPAVLTEITVWRHKAGRRCVVGYAFTGPRGDFTLVGKVRAKGADVRTYQLQHALWQRGLGAGRVQVPQPLGLSRELSSWWQRAVPGLDGPDALARDGARAAERCAEALATLHATDPPAGLPRHGWGDELGILDDRLASLARERPDWAPRLGGVMSACRRLGSTLASRPQRLVHRDFYPEQVRVDDGIVYLLDLDLCSLGDPALDVGNFVAHVLEEAVRRSTSLAAARRTAEAFATRYRQLAPDGDPTAVDAATTIALARLVQIAWSKPARRASAERLLEACEARAFSPTAA
jgi:aminoglycoside phosphotransferase (APT) family kinase protein